MGAIALQKGEKAWAWKLYTVLGWIGFEIIGITTGMIAFPNTGTIGYMICGYAFATASYFILKKILSSKPDQDTDHFSFDFENKQ
jgi:hypothetical protein